LEPFCSHITIPLIGEQDFKCLRIVGIQMSMAAEDVVDDHHGRRLSGRYALFLVREAVV
jgi:hypothetical protein